jgi:hypothetical protein
MANLRVTGAEDLAVLSARAKAAGPKIHRRMNRGIRKAVKPTIESVKGSKGMGRLPSGLNAWMQDTKFTTRIRAHGTTAGVRVVAAKKGHDVYSIDKGTARHPVYGRAPWVDQAVPPGFFTEVVNDERERMFKDVRAEFRDFARELSL